MGGRWHAQLDARKLIVCFAVVGALVAGSTSAFAGNGETMTVTPSTVAYDEEFTISGTGCFSQVVVGVEEIPGSQGGVTPDVEGNWSTTRSASIEQGVPPGALTVFASCIEPEFDYPDVEITLVGTDISTTTSEPVPSTTEADGSVDGATAPRFTG